MPETLDKKVGEWREADSKARELEKSLTRLLFQHAEGSQPPQELIIQARVLRERANEKLKAAIEAMRPKP